MTLHPKSSQTVELTHLDFKQTWAMSFSTLPLDSRTLFPNEIQNLLSSEKRTLDHWATVQFFFFLVQGKTPLTTTVAKFLDTSVCGGSWCLDPASVHSLWSWPKFLNRFSLTILIRLRLSQLVVHLFFTFSSTFFWIQHSVNSQLLWQWMFMAYPPCEGCQ